MAACKRCYLPHSFDAVWQRHCDVLGRLRSGLALRSFVSGLTLPMLDLTLSAMAAVALQKLASRTGPLSASTADGSRQALSMAGRVSTSEASGRYRSCTPRVVIGGCIVASSPLRPADDRCRHPPSKLLPECNDFGRCNPTMTLSDLQYAVRVWGPCRGRHRP
jgi:hypothetical protein